MCNLDSCRTRKGNMHLQLLRSFSFFLLRYEPGFTGRRGIINAIRAHYQCTKPQNKSHNNGFFILPRFLCITTMLYLNFFLQKIPVIGLIERWERWWNGCPRMIQSSALPSRGPWPFFQVRTQLHASVWNPLEKKSALGFFFSLEMEPLKIGCKEIREK